MPSAVVENLTEGSTYGYGYRFDLNTDCPKHPPISARPCPKTLGRLVGVVEAILLLLFAGLFNLPCIFPGAYYRSLLTIEILKKFEILTRGLCIEFKMISDLESLAVHRGNTSAATTSYGTIGQV